MGTLQGTIYNNPFNYAGQLHNQGVDYVINHLTPANVTTELIVDNTVDFFMSLNSNYTIEDRNALYEIVSSSINCIDSTVLDNFLVLNQVKEQSRFWINQILNFPSTLDYDYTLQSLQSLEISVITSNLSEIEKRLPLITAAIAKYSNIYWLGVLSSPGVWPSFDPNYTLMKWPWKADGEGAIYGGIVGVGIWAVYGGPFTGPGALPSLGISVAIGAAAGAVGASVRKALGW